MKDINLCERFIKSPVVRGLNAGKRFASCVVQGYKSRRLEERYSSRSNQWLPLRLYSKWPQDKRTHARLSVLGSHMGIARPPSETWNLVIYVYSRTDSHQIQQQQRLIPYFWAPESKTHILHSIAWRYLTVIRDAQSQLIDFSLNAHWTKWQSAPSANARTRKGLKTIVYWPDHSIRVYHYTHIRYNHVYV